MTRNAYKLDTLSRNAAIERWRFVADSNGKESRRHLQALANAERELLAVHATVAQMVAQLPIRTDSVRARDEIIAAQVVEIQTGASALAESKAAFDRLTAKDAADSTRADVAEAGLSLANLRLGIAERALAIETARTGCYIDIIVKRVKCPSRGVMLVVGAAAGVAADRLYENRANK